MGLVSLLSSNPQLFFVIAAALVLSVTIHEFSHAYVAFRLGDPTAKNLGRLSLNPLAHLDPIGTLSILLIGFGWGKAVPVNYYNFRNPKRDAGLVSLAGPGSNFLMALLVAIFIKLSGIPFTPSLSGGSTLIGSLSSGFIIYNLFLGAFNMLPIEPLDGFKIVNSLLPPKLSVQWVQLAPYGIFILLFLMVTNSISRIITPIVILFLRILGF